MKLDLSIVDVFAEKPLAGNQLAVVRDAAALSDGQMQDIAREMNFSETTFITGESDGRASVRIFTPSRELPFAGHPTVGTAWELTQGEGEITLDLAVGPVAVAFEDGIGWMVPPEVEFQGAMDSADAARLLGIDEGDFDPEFPIELAEVGPSFALLPVKSLSVLKSVAVASPIDRSLFVFTADAYGESADFASRMFFDAGGIREDPATGSANTAFAAYLRKHRGDLGSVVVDQGVEINRPSRLYLEVGSTLRVGGKVQPVLTGEIRA